MRVSFAGEAASRVSRLTAVAKSFGALWSATPLPVPWLLAALAAALGAGAAAALMGPLAAAAVGGAAAVLAFSYLAWPLAPISLIAIAIAIPRFQFEVNELTLIPERIVIPIVAAVFLVRVLIRRDERLFAGWSHVGLGLFVLGLTLGSIFNAPDRNLSLRLTLLVGIAAVLLWLVPLLVRNVGTLRIGLLVLLAVGGIEAAIGLLAMANHLLTGSSLGMQFDWLSGGMVPFGTHWEGNTFGSFVGAAFVLALARWMYAPSFRPRWWVYGAFVLLTSLAVFVSSARGAWLGAIAGGGVVGLYASRDRVLQVLSGLVLGGTLAFTLFQAGAQIAQTPLERVGSLAGLLQGQLDATTLERLYTFELALAGWRSEPIIGRGTGSLGQIHTYLSSALPAWVGNLELHALHDGGILATAGLLLALLGTVISLVRAIRRTHRADSYVRASLIGLLGACVSLMVAFQATESTWLGYGWFVFGLAWAAGTLWPLRPTSSMHKRERERLRDRPTTTSWAQASEG